ncbi:hypothetical protein [Halorhodospira halophila]|uniref:hypothetical protein n=1 Tax=Halorhodospira halophila TaxID=1053 RepID=UPI0019137F0F|nr:hypothetical protein [Halorhodospira halophila]
MLEKAITRGQALRKIGKKAIIKVDPSVVDLHYGEVRPRTGPLVRFLENYGVQRKVVDKCRKQLDHLEPFVISGESFPNGRYVAGISDYQKIKDFIERSQFLEETLWYHQLLKKINQSGVAWHNNMKLTSSEDVKSF